MMTTQEFKGRINEFKGKIKSKWGQLTDDDFNTSQGNLDQLIGRIQQKTGQTRESIEKFFNELGDGAHGAVQQASEFVTQAAERVRENAGAAIEQAKEGYEHVREYADQGLRDTRKVVRQHPTESLMVALGVGVTVGLLVGMSMRSA